MHGTWQQLPGGKDKAGWLGPGLGYGNPKYSKPWIYAPNSGSEKKCYNPGGASSQVHINSIFTSKI